MQGELSNILARLGRYRWYTADNKELQKFQAAIAEKEKRVLFELNVPHVIDQYEHDIQVHSTAPLIIANCCGYVYSDVEKIIQISGQKGDIESQIKESGIIESVYGDIEITVPKDMNLFVVNHMGNVNGNYAQGIIKYSQSLGFCSRTLIIQDCQGSLNFRYKSE